MWLSLGVCVCDVLKCVDVCVCVCMCVCVCQCRPSRMCSVAKVCLRQCDIVSGVPHFLVSHYIIKVNGL